MFRSRQIAGRPHLAGAAILGVFVGFAAAEEAPRLRSAVRAAPKIGDIRIDGVLDEPAWSAAGVIPDLLQQAPRPGEPTPYRTEVRILADPGAIYVAITCADPEPGRIAVHTLQRDGDMTGDDSVALVFDTFKDRRAYLFRVNAPREPAATGWSPAQGRSHPGS
ncbi:MAG: hypothetical protein M3167_14925 [Acidobacteriota bacterium]|nr:hypothetical protein [Acidobacteriota bacterium]